MNRQIISNTRKIQNLIDKYKPLDDDELKRDMARYVCVLVSGFIEESLRLLIADYTKGKSSPIIHQYVDSNIKKITNCHFNRILEILNAFHHPWANNFCATVRIQEPIQDQYKDSVDSVVAIRHRIAHGKSTGISMVTIHNYYINVIEVVRILDLSIK